MSVPNAGADPTASGARSWGELLAVFGRIAAQSFGGPAGQIAVMHRILVEERRWLSEALFLHALNYCMLLPGPEAMQLATYAGWLQRGTAGGLAAGLLFVAPGALTILALSAAYLAFGDTRLLASLFFGLKAAVLAIVLAAIVRLARRALGARPRWLVAITAFLATFLFVVPYPYLVIGAALVGWGIDRVRPGSFATPLGEQETVDPTPVSHRATLGRLGRWLVVWTAPIALAWAILGRSHVLVELALYFSQVAAASFGGAYAVLSWVAEHAVGAGWLRPHEMVDGLGLAETTPGPLIMVVQFVGFLAGARFPGALGSWESALLAAGMVSWVTFAPCFLWIFVGAPYVERLRGRRGLDAALGGITAAVVGVMANLGVWFALHVVFRRVSEGHLGPLRILVPLRGSFDPIALALAGLAAYLLLGRKWGMGTTMLVVTSLGLVVALLR